MKHATPVALDGLDRLLAQVREFGALTERKRGVFYRRSSAFLHFHEDPAGFFADLRTGPIWERLPVNTKTDQRQLLKAIARAIEPTR